MKKATKSLGSHFKNFKKEKQKLKGFCRFVSFNNQEKCENGDPFKLSEMVWIQIRKESPGKLFLNIRRKKKY
jgi:hypothetical protein